MFSRFFFFFPTPVYENTKTKTIFNILPQYIWIQVLASSSFWTVLYDILIHLLTYPIELGLLLVLKQKKRNLQWFWTTFNQSSWLPLSFTPKSNKSFRIDKKTHLKKLSKISKSRMLITKNSKRSHSIVPSYAQLLKYLILTRYDVYLIVLLIT